MKGLDKASLGYLGAAERGYRFLLEHFHDADHGGYRWMTDRAGHTLNDAKILYGQAFVVYALVELARAGGGSDALSAALDLHRAVNEHTHDSENGGWFEHTTPDWCVLPIDDPRAVLDVAGLKSANANVHWLEALIELYDATGTEDVRRSLLEALRVNHQYFFPPDPAQCCQYRQRDWSPVAGAASNAVSYGHNVEFAWMLIRAETVLGLPPSWELFYAHLDHALRNGYDDRRGGAYHAGFGNQPATRTEKVWWVQAELAVALTDALLHRWDHRYSGALVQTLGFVERHQTDHRDGVWVQAVTAKGRRQEARKAGPWKVGYHEVRALVRLVEAFGQRPTEE